MPSFRILLRGSVFGLNSRFCPLASQDLGDLTEIEYSDDLVRPVSVVVDTGQFWDGWERSLEEQVGTKSGI